MFELICDGRCVCRSGDRNYVEKILRCQRTVRRNSKFSIRTIS